MDSVFRVQPKPLINAIVDTLKSNGNISLPENHDIIKTGHGKQYSPENPDWYYVRMAAIVRQAMRFGTVSRKGLAHRYGIRKNRGVRPTKFARASDFVNHSAIEELKKIGWFNFDNEENILTKEAKDILGEIVDKINE
ncbi:small subunit ribosomal protein S19e [Enteropsectra breve]|nr:small subunit ribosomal protein S19e [Enteropsectra breve]